MPGLQVIFGLECAGHSTTGGHKIRSQSVCNSALVETFFCYPPAGKWHGSEIYSAIAGTRLQQNHGDLHPYHPESAKKIAIALACKAIFLFRGLQPLEFGILVAYEYFWNMENAQRILNIGYEYVREEMRGCSAKGEYAQ